MYWDMQHGHGYTARTGTWICSLDGNMDKQHVLAHADVHVQTTCPSSCYMSKSMLHAKAHAACPDPWCMDLNMQN
jgi:hypothetical protein